MALAFFNVNLPSVTSLIIAMVSGFYPGTLFVKDFGRLPEKSERRRFAVASLIVITIFSFIAVTAIFLLVGATMKDASDFFTRLPVWVMPVIAVVVMALYYFVIGSGFKTGAKIQLKAQGKSKGSL